MDSRRWDVVLLGAVYLLSSGMLLANFDQVALWDLYSREDFANY